MIIFDIRLCNRSILVERWTRKAPFKITRERQGEVIVDAFRLRVMLTNHNQFAIP